MRNLKQDLRLISAIAQKDIVTAIKNKQILTVFVMLIFLVALYTYLPTIDQHDEPPYLFVYDAGDSALLPQLMSSPIFNTYERDSVEHIERTLKNSGIAEIGIVLPEGFDNQTGNIELEGYAADWYSDELKASFSQLVQDEIYLLDAQEVTINWHLVYPDKDSSGNAFLASLTLIIVLTMIGMVAVPHIILEEKETKTLDVLMVSPASVSHIVLGKAVMGIFYCSVAGIIVLLLNIVLIVHWWLALLAVFLGVLMLVEIGMLIGLIVPAQTQLVLWVWLAMPPLVISVFLADAKELLPEAIYPVIDWIPTVALSRLLRVSFSDNAAFSQFAAEFVYLIATIICLFGFIVWLIRRSDR